VTAPSWCGRCGLRQKHDGSCECSPSDGDRLDVEEATNVVPVRTLAEDIAQIVALDGPFVRVDGLAVQVAPLRPWPPSEDA
jgi:hypothetical protein